MTDIMEQLNAANSNDDYMINPTISIIAGDINRDEAVADAARVAREVASDHGIAPEDVEYVVRASQELAGRYIDSVGGRNSADLSINDIFASVNALVYDVRKAHPDIPLSAYRAVVPSVTASAVDFWYRSVGHFNDALSDANGVEKIYSAAPVSGPRRDMADMSDEEFEEYMTERPPGIESLAAKLDPAQRSAADYMADKYGRELRALKQRADFESMTPSAVVQWSEEAVQRIREQWLADGREIDEEDWDIMADSAAAAVVELWRNDRMGTRRRNSR